MDPEELLRHAGFVRAIARGLLAEDDAEDVVEDTMLAALRRPPGDPSRARAWLGAVARRLSLKRLRGDRRRDTRERAAARREALPSAAEVLGQLEVQRKVVEAVVALDEPYRSTVVHRYFHERSVGEIAEALGVPRKTVESRLTRALAMLRARLDAEHGGRRAWTVALLPLAWPREGAAAGGLLAAAKAKAPAAVVSVAVAGLGVAAVMWVGAGEDGPKGRAARATREEASAGPVEALPAARGGPAARTGTEAMADALPPVPPAPPGGITGRVVRADGKPAAHARVWTAGSDNEAKDIARLETVADENGVYRFEGLVPANYRVGATHEGHAPSDEHGPSYGVTPGHGWEIPVINLRVGGTLRAVVRDIAGAPVEGAEVEVLRGIVIREDQQPTARAVTSERGEAVLDHLPGGESVRVRAQGETAVRTCVPIHDRSVTVVEFVVGARLFGSVSLDDGTAVQGATLRCFGPMSGPSSATRVEAPIDATGRAVIGWLPPGDYEVEVVGVGIASAPGRVRVGPEPAFALPLRLGRSVVSGRVRHEEPSGGQVYVKLLSPKQDRWLSTAAAPDGSFAFYDVAPGEYVLHARENGGLDATLRVAVGRGERVEGRELVLRRAYGEVELEILDAKGAFAGSVQLYLGDTSIAPPAVGAGRYRFRAPAGPRTITVQWANGSRSTKADLDVEEGRTVYKTVRLPE